MEEVMSALIVGIFIVWVGFSSIFTTMTAFSDNTTRHTNIIELCNDVGQFQYEKTVVLCEVKKPKTKE